jgi:hypothetical protein
MYNFLYNVKFIYLLLWKKNEIEKSSYIIPIYILNKHGTQIQRFNRIFGKT